jgi:predicted MPP superfamily phosphohydrolase
MPSFGLLILAAWALLVLYVFTRAASVPAVVRLVPRRALFAAAGLLFAWGLATRTLGHGAAGRLARTLELVGMDTLAALFLFAVALLAADLVTGFGFLLPRAAPRVRGWALGAGALLVAAAVVQGLRPPVVTRHEVALAGLPAERDGTVLVALSDLHLGTLLDGAWLAARIAQVQAERPDLVVLLGDLFEGHGQPEGEMLPVFRTLHAPLGVFAVTGNHEFHGREANLRMLDAAGFPVLHDRWAAAGPGLVVAGVDDLTARRRAGLAGDPVGAALAGRPPGAAILLSHSPLEAKRAAAAGAGLMLAGHTHGGQIWPFGYLVGAFYPLFAGRYEVDGMPLIVTRGAGTWGPRMRLWRRAEILRVTLRSPARRERVEPPP